MGSFDTVHTGLRCGQTKALGKGLRDLTPGMTVRTYPCAMNAADFTLELTGQIPPGPDSFQVQMTEGGYLTVHDTTLLGWGSDRDAELPLFDNLGHPLTADSTPAADATGDDGAAGDPDSHLKQLERQAALGVETDNEIEISRLFDLPVLADLEPGTAAHTDRVERLRRDARDELDCYRGLPVNCDICTRLRTS